MRIQLGTDLLYLGLRFAYRFGRHPLPAAAFRPEKVKKLLIVSTTAVGDTVMSTSGLRALRHRYPEAHLTALLHPVTGRLLDDHPAIDKTIYYSGRYGDFFPTLLRLRRLKADAALVFHGNEPQITPLLALAGIPFLFKLPNTSRYRFLLSNSEPRLAWPDLGHGLHQRLAVARLVDANSEDPRMWLPPISAKSTAKVEQLLSTHGVSSQTPLIGLQIGASKPHRAWPEQHFIALGKALSEKHPDLRLIVTGSHNETESGKRIADGIGETAINLTGKLRLEELPALVQSLKLLVTGDTGPMHIAIALRIPTVCLFGASDPAGAGPIYDLDRHTLIVKAKDGTYSSTLPMARISVDEVLNAVEASLERHFAD